MVDIISRKSVPRREDVSAQRIINKNWPVISRLADQISNGGYTRSRQAIANARKSPEPEQSTFTLSAERPGPLSQNRSCASA